MIPAHKNVFLDCVLYWLLRRSLCKHFYCIHAAGMDYLRNLKPDRPGVAFSNHTNWWDGLTIFFLTRFLPSKDFYCMMEEKQLQHYKFFAWLGAYSVDLNNPLRSAVTVRYTLELLKERRNLIWVFPQGKMMREYDKIRVQQGVDFMAQRVSHAQMLPATFRYEFRGERLPEIFIRFGAPYLAHENTPERLEGALQELTDRLRDDCRKDHLEDYEKLLRPRQSIDKHWRFARMLLLGHRRAVKSEN
jgi:1-acyl-sn-glycerol-3-phosphate acyltransferase